MSAKGHRQMCRQSARANAAGVQRYCREAQRAMEAVEVGLLNGYTLGDGGEALELARHRLAVALETVREMQAAAGQCRHAFLPVTLESLIHEDSTL